MNILITGGAGFIGTNLTKKLLDEGNFVFGLDNFYSGQKSNIDLFKDNSQYKFIEHDINVPIDFDFEKLDRIYNLACPASPPSYQKDPLFTTKTCVIGLLNVLDLAKKYNARILQASTSEVYGDPLEHPQKESYRGNVNTLGIRSCYDEGKRVGESLMMDYYRMYKTDIRIIRIFNTYGPYMDPDDGRVVSNFINQVLKKGDITIYGDGSQTRSFQYIDDLLTGMTKMMENENNFIGPVNLGNPDEFTVRDLAEKVNKLLSGESEIIYKDFPEDDPKLRRPDISLAKEKLGWEPEIKLEQGLGKTIEYFESIL